MRSDNDAVYADYDFIVQETKQPISVALGIPVELLDEANFHGVNNYADTVRAMDFEGVSYPNTFTSDSWFQTEEIQKIYLTQLFSNDTRNLWMSRIMRKPIKIMQNKVSKMLGFEIDPEDDLNPFWADLKYMIYSAHDTQVDNMEYWLDPSDYEMDFILFASQVFFELKYTDSCLAERNSVDCFWVDILYNNVPLAFSDFCEGHNGLGCIFDEFNNMMQAKWYNGEYAPNIDMGCEQEYIN